jgi:hypothetical protein
MKYHYTKPTEYSSMYGQLYECNTITRVKDWLGHTNQMPMALTIQEAEIFVAKIKELREGS